MKKTIVKINKSWFFEMINKIDKTLARPVNRNEKDEINKIRH